MTFASGYFEVKKFKGLRKSEFQHCFIMHARLHDDMFCMGNFWLKKQLKNSTSLFVVMNELFIEMRNTM